DVGIHWSTHPTEEETLGEYERVWSRLGGRAIEDLVDLPLMQHREALATLDVLASLDTPALCSGHEQWGVLSICRSTSISLEHGNRDAAWVRYAQLGIIASARIDHCQEGYLFGRMACDLVERRGFNRFGGKTFLLFAVLVPWTRPLGDGIDPARRAFEMAKE